MLHRRTHPEPVEGCFGCKVLSVSLSLPPAFSTKDRYAANKTRVDRILKQRAEKREGLTDLRYGRQVSRETELATLMAPNLDGHQVKTLPI